MDYPCIPRYAKLGVPSSRIKTFGYRVRIGAMFWFVNGSSFAFMVCDLAWVSLLCSIALATEYLQWLKLCERDFSTQWLLDIRQLPYSSHLCTHLTGQSIYIARGNNPLKMVLPAQDSWKKGMGIYVKSRVIFCLYLLEPSARWYKPWFHDFQIFILLLLSLRELKEDSMEFYKIHGGEC